MTSHFAATMLTVFCADKTPLIESLMSAYHLKSFRQVFGLLLRKRGYWNLKHSTKACLK
uniref:Uncharacterized protein n=1 Tax=Arundo donax TaxID=35708 RepID=A0A0A9CA31_ARUDO